MSVCVCICGDLAPLRLSASLYWLGNHCGLCLWWLCWIGSRALSFGHLPLPAQINTTSRSHSTNVHWQIQASAECMPGANIHMNKYQFGIEREWWTVTGREDKAVPRLGNQVALGLVWEVQASWRNCHRASAAFTLSGLFVCGMELGVQKTTPDRVIEAFKWLDRGQQNLTGHEALNIGI